MYFKYTETKRKMNHPPQRHPYFKNETTKQVCKISRQTKQGIQAKRQSQRRQAKQDMDPRVRVE